MKKIFTLALVMVMAMTSFAQVKKAVRPSFKNMKAEQAVTIRGTEEGAAFTPIKENKGIVASPQETQLSFTTYDWQTNQAQRNFTAVWPDGFAVMCYTMSTDASQSFGDRGTGLAIWDPAVGEWEFTESRVEGTKTGFGSISRYKENGLVIAAHTATDLRIFLVEDFRDGNRDFGQGIAVPVTSGVDPCWPVVQCSGANLDIVNVLCTNSGATSPCTDPIIYYQYANGEWTKQYEIIPNLDGSNMTEGGSNITFFMEYDPAKPDRVSFILNNAWSDGKLVISEDNGATWSERVFFQHPGINGTYESLMYPRWVDASFDADDNLSIVYEYNGTSESAGSGKYYPGLGGVAFWSEILPKNDSCVGGIGNVGEPFIMDTNYISNDLYSSCWYWSNAVHYPVPEHFGMFQILDMDGNVYPWEAEEWPEEYMWLNLDGDSGGTQSSDSHGKYNNGTVCFPSMHVNGNDVYCVWSMLAGDSENYYYDSETSKHRFRLFGAVSHDKGFTWSHPKHLLTDFMNIYDEMIYGQLIPYVYTDTQGSFLLYCYQNDRGPGSQVGLGGESPEDSDMTDTKYRAFKIYLDYLHENVEENNMTVEQMINVYPNPAQGSFNVTLNNESDVNIYNTVGQLVKTYKSVKQLNVNLESGVYFVNAGNQTVKVVVK